MEEILNSQTSTLGINDFLRESQKYTKELFPDVEELFNKSLSGNIDNIFSLDIIERIFLGEISGVLSMMINIILIIIIHSIFKAIVDNLENASISKIAYMVQYLLIVTIITDSFIQILDITKDSITDIINFMNLFTPILITLMLATGNLVTTSVVEPVILFMISFIGNFINGYLIPILLIGATFAIIANFSEKTQIDKISKFLSSAIVWCLGIILTFFTCTLSIEGTLSSSVDGLTAKTAKAAVSSMIPVVGKIMGDATETVIGCGNILKNSVGIIGVIIIIGISLIPIIKITVLMLSLKITSVVCDVVADVKIIKLLENISDTYKILLGILIAVSIMFIIGITIVIRMTNSSIMYR